MAENTEEEQLGKQINTQSEKFPDEIIPTPETDSINLNHEIENMEVHHHAHDPALPHHKKNWKSYFWEFLMLFLAVFCGFLAEYQLEHVIENQREEVYIHSMIEDLEKDRTNFANTIKNFQNNVSHLEKVLWNFEEGRKNNQNNWAQEFVYTARMGYMDFHYTDRTIQQLKNSGSMRLIRNEKVAAAIVEYDAAIKDLIGEIRVLSYYQGTYMEAIDKAWSFNKLFKDQGVIKWQRDPMLPVTKNYWTTDKESDFEFIFTQGSHYYYTYFRLIKELNQLKKKTTEMVSLLSSEYQLK